MIRERKPNRLKGYDYSSDNLYFVTSCVHNRICCFGEIVPDNSESSVVGTGRDINVGTGRDINVGTGRDNVGTGRDNVGTGRDLSLHRNGDIPFIGTGRDPSLQQTKIKSLSELIGAYKTTVSKQIHLLERMDQSRCTDRSRPVRTSFAWQRSFYENIIRDEKSFETISDYILNNPNNWEQDNHHIL